MSNSKTKTAKEMTKTANSKTTKEMKKDNKKGDATKQRMTQTAKKGRTSQAGTAKKPAATAAVTNPAGLTKAQLAQTVTVESHIIETMKKNKKSRDEFFSLIPGFSGTWEITAVVPESSKKERERAEKANEDPIKDYFNLVLKHVTNGYSMVLNGIEFLESYLFTDDEFITKEVDAAKKYYTKIVDKTIKDHVKRIYKKDTFYMEPEFSVLPYVIPKVNTALNMDAQGNLVIPKYIHIKGAVTVEESFYVDGDALVDKASAAVRRPYVSKYRYYGFAPLATKIQDDNPNLKSVKKTDVFNYIKSNPDNGFFAAPGEFEIKIEVARSPKTWFNTLLIEVLK